jgi:hypothetical protein
LRGEFRNNKAQKSKEALLLSEANRSGKTKITKMKTVFIILPLLTFNKYDDGRKEITIGWLTKTVSIRF